jgi:hypothetical protein
MQRAFDTPDPEGLPNLNEKLPEGVLVKNILYRYDVTPEGGMRNLDRRPYIHCAHCQGAHHWRGFVIEIENGTLALLGKNCGEDQFGIDFRRVERDFNVARSRQADLRRVIEIRALLPAFESDLEVLRRSGAMRAFDTYMLGLRRFGRLPRALQRMAEKNDGLLTCTSFRRDREAEARRAEKLPQSKHFQEKIAGAPTPYMRQMRVQEYERWLESQPPIEHETVETIGHMVGSGIFVVEPGGMVAGMQAAREALAVEIDAFLCSRSDEWTSTRRLQHATRMLRLRVELVHRALGLLAELDRFTAAENLGVIAQWSQREVQLPQPRIDTLVRAEGRTLTDEDGRYALALPGSWGLPATPALDALRAKLGD